jgi:hypothetical protein
MSAATEQADACGAHHDRRLGALDPGPELTQAV